MVSTIISRIVEAGFPAGARVVESAIELPLNERFWLISNTQGPRWLIPHDYSYGFHAFLQWRPYGLLSHIKWKVLCRIYRAGQLGRLPEVNYVGIAGCSQNQWSHLGWCEDVHPVPVVYIGTPGATQKAVISLVNSYTRKVVSIAKIPLGREASTNIFHEYGALSKLSTTKPGVAPRPYYMNYDLGSSSQEALRGRLVGRKYLHEYDAYLNSLQTASEVSVYEKSQVLIEKILRIDNGSSNIKESLFDVLSRLRDKTVLPAYYVHGDFVPWNIFKTECGHIVATDWEMADLEGLPLYDYFYYHYQQNYLFKQSAINIAPNGLLIKDISKQLIGEIKKYTLASMAMQSLLAGNNASYFLKEIDSSV